MSYTPTEWKTGDIVTSTKLNKLEQGVANASGGALVVEATTQNGTDFTADITIGELYEAALTGPVIIHSDYTFNNGARDTDAGLVLPLVEAAYQVIKLNY